MEVNTLMTNRHARCPMGMIDRWVLINILYLNIMKRSLTHLDVTYRRSEWWISDWGHRWLNDWHDGWMGNWHDPWSMETKILSVNGHDQYQWINDWFDGWTHSQCHTWKGRWNGIIDGRWTWLIAMDEMIDALMIELNVMVTGEVTVSEYFIVIWYLNIM